MSEASTETATNQYQLPLNTTNYSDRYRNAERLSRALRSYMQLDEALIKSRGRTKDKRICQLNAAYKYCIHLEATVRGMCEREGVPVADDCNLVHSTAASNNTDEDAVAADNMPENDEDSIMIDEASTSYLTPNQQTNWSIHESSTLSSAVAFNNTNASNVSTGMMTRRRLQRHLQNSFQHAVDASPILGGPSTQTEHSTGDMKDLRARLNGKKRKAESSTIESTTEQASVDDNTELVVEMPPIKQTLRSKIDSLDLNNNSEHTRNNNPSSEKAQQETHFNTPSSVSSCGSDLLSSTKNTKSEESSSSTRHYFLRSMNRSKSGQLDSSRHSTPTTQQRNRMKRTVQSKLDSSLASSSSGSSLTTPLSLRSTASGSDVSSSTGHSSIMNDLETMDARQLLKADITDAQLSTIFDLNQSELHRTKCSMNFL
jgi:hypothetical protein